MSARLEQMCKDTCNVLGTIIGAYKTITLTCHSFCCTHGDTKELRWAPDSPSSDSKMGG